MIYMGAMGHILQEVLLICQNKIFYLRMTEFMQRFVFQMDEYMTKQHMKLFKCIKHE